MRKSPGRQSVLRQPPLNLGSRLSRLQETQSKIEIKVLAAEKTQAVVAGVVSDAVAALLPSVPVIFPEFASKGGAKIKFGRVQQTTDTLAARAPVLKIHSAPLTEDLDAVS